MGLVRTRKTAAGQQAHQLETAEGETCQDMKRKWPSDGHSPTGYRRGRDLSGHKKKVTEGRVLTSWEPQRERLVRTQRECDRERGTHFLVTTEGGTCQDMGRKRPSNGHPLARERRGKGKSGNGKDMQEHREGDN